MPRLYAGKARHSGRKRQVLAEKRQTGKSTECVLYFSRQTDNTARPENSAEYAAPQFRLMLWSESCSNGAASATAALSPTGSWMA